MAQMKGNVQVAIVNCSYSTSSWTVSKGVNWKAETREGQSKDEPDGPHIVSGY